MLKMEETGSSFHCRQRGRVSNFQTSLGSGSKRSKQGWRDPQTTHTDLWSASSAYIILSSACVCFRSFMLHPLTQGWNEKTATQPGHLSPWTTFFLACFLFFFARLNVGQLVVGSRTARRKQTRGGGSLFFSRSYAKTGQLGDEESTLLLRRKEKERKCVKARREQCQRHMDRTINLLARIKSYR